MILIIFLNKAFAGWERYSMEDLNAQQWALIAVGNHCVQISDNTFHHPANISFAVLVLHLPHQLGLHHRKREKCCCAAAGVCREQVNALHAGAAPWVMANGDMAQLQVLNESWYWNHSVEPLCGVKSANVSESVHSRSTGIILLTEDGCSVQKSGCIRFVSLEKNTQQIKRIGGKANRVSCEIKVHIGLQLKRL